MERKSHQYVNDFSFLVKSTKLLRVLDFEQFRFDRGFPYGVVFLVHLRYLAIRGRISCVPSSIENLFSLETLVVWEMQGEVSVPRTIWKLRRLRHLQIRERAVFEGEDGDDNTFLPFDIESIATLDLLYGDVFTRNILTKLPRLRKLRCVFMEWWEDCEGGRRYKLPVLDCLSALESLKVVYDGRARRNFAELNFPGNLKRLILSKLHLPWSMIWQIGSLPNLEVLKLLFKSFGNTWDVSEGEFPSLKFLKFYSLDIAKWNASSDCFPCLEHLVLEVCWKLEGIPCEIGELDMLREIEVNSCWGGAAESAEMIHQGQMDLGNSDLQVHINQSGRIRPV